MIGVCPGIDPFIPSWDIGEAARDAGVARADNPYRDPKECRQHRGWDSGWVARDARLAERLVRNVALEAFAR